MTVPTVRRTPAAPDDQIPDHAESRPAHQVRTGWHVRVAVGGMDRWLLIESAEENRNTVYLFFADRTIAPVTVGRQSPLWCRTPAEHIAASTWGSK